jgi:hypothetical protein
MKHHGSNIAAGGGKVQLVDDFRLGRRLTDNFTPLFNATKAPLISQGRFLRFVFQLRSRGKTLR